MIGIQCVGMEEVRSWAERRGSGTALVMGGGPSLPEDFNRVMDIEADAVLVSVKQHAMIYLAAEEDIAAEVCCFLEDPDAAGQEGLKTAILMSPGTWQVSPFYGWSNVVIDEPWWNGGFSSTLATWFACAAGFERVLLAGMDCYQGERKYWYDRPAYSHPCFNSSVEDNLAAWRPAGQFCHDADRIRAVSGPLVDLFGRWVP